jgi:DNA-binding FrmR family transcriptional regulator
MYSERNVAALQPLTDIFSRAGLPLMKLRKINGALNAVEMQIEDGVYSPEVVAHLCQAIEAQTAWLGLGALQSEVAAAVEHLKKRLAPPVKFR